MNLIQRIVQKRIFDGTELSLIAPNIAKLERLYSENKFVSVHILSYWIAFGCVVRSLPLFFKILKRKYS